MYSLVNFRLLCRQNWNDQNTNDLEDYVLLLKLVRYTNTDSETLKYLVFRIFFEFVQKPELFNSNLELLCEVDKLHQILYTRITVRNLLQSQHNRNIKFRFVSTLL